MQMSRTIIRHATGRLMLMIGLGALTPAAHATVEYAFQAGYSWYKFNNPFMFREGTNPADTDILNTAPDGTPIRRGYSDRTSDTATSLDIGAAFFIPFPTERSFLLISGAASKLKYGSMDYMNHTKKQWEGLYQWEYSTFLRGKLRHRTDQRLHEYSDGLSDKTLFYDPPGPAHNMHTNLEMPRTQENELEVALRITPRLDLPFTMTRQTRRYMDELNITPFNMDSDSRQLAVRYESGTKSTLLAGIKRTDTRFPFRTPTQIARYDSGYRDQELFLETNWRYTENMVIFAHLGRVQRHFNILQKKSLQAVHLGFDWHFSPKTTFYFRTWDRPESIDESGDKLYSQARGVQWRTTWQATWKTRLENIVSLEQERHDNFSTANSNLTQFTESQNKTLRIKLGINYDMTPRLALTSELWHRKNVSGQGYTQTSIHAGIKYSFENMTGKNRARLKLDELQ